MWKMLSLLTSGFQITCKSVLKLFHLEMSDQLLVLFREFSKPSVLDSWFSCFFYLNTVPELGICL